MLPKNDAEIFNRPVFRAKSYSGVLEIRQQLGEVIIIILQESRIMLIKSCSICLKEEGGGGYGDEVTRSVVSNSQGGGTKLSLSGVTQGSSKIHRTEGNTPTKFLSWSF